MPTTCEWPDCDREAKSDPGFSFPGTGRAILLCVEHQDKWTEMVDEQRYPELLAIFDLPER
jgi:hypothetical protein